MAQRIISEKTVMAAELSSLCRREDRPTLIIGKAHSDPEDAKQHLSQLTEIMKAFGTVHIALETPNYTRNQLIFSRLPLLSRRKIEEAAKRAYRQPEYGVAEMLGFREFMRRGVKIYLIEPSTESEGEGTIRALIADFMDLQSDIYASPSLAAAAESILAVFRTFSMANELREKHMAKRVNELNEEVEVPIAVSAGLGHVFTLETALGNGIVISVANPLAAKVYELKVEADKAISKGEYTEQDLLAVFKHVLYSSIAGLSRAQPILDHIAATTSIRDLEPLFIQYRAIIDGAEVF